MFTQCVAMCVQRAVPLKFDVFSLKDEQNHKMYIFKLKHAHTHTHSQYVQFTRDMGFSEEK